MQMLRIGILIIIFFKKLSENYLLYAIQKRKLRDFFCHVKFGLKMYGVPQGSQILVSAFGENLLRLSKFELQINMKQPFNFRPLDAVQH